MQVDVNEPKSKAYNVFLRMFQLGCQIILAYWALRIDGITDCDFNTANITSYIAYGLAGLNIISVIAVRCSDKFPRCFFFIVFILDLLMALGIISLNGLNGYSRCAASKTFYHFSIIQTAIQILVVFVILIMRLVWGQRYSNSPGNLVWAGMFLPFQWSLSFEVFMLIIGIGAAVVSIVTFLFNLSTLIKTSTSTRKMLSCGWIFGLVILVALEGLAIYKYLVSNNLTEYADIHAKKTLAVFILVNGLDILFWLWGMKTLDYEKGDQIRQDLFSGKQQNPRATRVQQSVVISNDIGTINRN